jgi:hypothetical protein
VAPDPKVGDCDPVCQLGCACTQRCQLVSDANSDYSFDCQTPPAGSLLDDFKTCDTKNDLCKPGLLCLTPPKDSTGCGNQCYRACRQDSDCPAKSFCVLSIDLNATQSAPICSPPVVVCNPALTTAVTGCANSLTGPNCYVFSNNQPDETMCDCAGTLNAGAACQDLHSCVAGYECVGGKCQRLCSLVTGGTVACASGQICKALHGKSTKYGTCQ